MPSEATKDFWSSAAGSKVVVDGIAYRLKVNRYQAVYPHKHEALSVAAVPVNKRTKFYRDTKRELGDDWSTDVLASPDFEIKVLSELALGDN